MTSKPCFGLGPRALGLSLMLLATLTFFVERAAAQASAEELAKANDPLADIKAFNLQNYYIPKLFGIDDQVANTFWLRAAMPTGPVLWRASLPFGTVPSGGDPIDGVGDLQLFGAYLAVKKPTLSFGIGPQVAFPTASDDPLGTGKWQGGLASVVFGSVGPAFQIGGLVTWQASFAGDDDRKDTSFLAAQPFAMFQLGGGTYLRSAPIWAFDLKSGDYNVPFGFGVGKVTKVGGTVFNIFLEPQFTIFHDGVGQPAFQLYTALNMQFTGS